MKISRILNPGHDMDLFHPISIDPIDIAKNRAGYYIGIAKNSLRGILFGSVFGAAIGLGVDESIFEGVKDGASAGLVLDSMTYKARYWWNTVNGAYLIKKTADNLAQVIDDQDDRFRYAG